jgi:hypothetical protein
MDRREPLRVALLLMLVEDAAAWRIDGLNTIFVEYVRSDVSFDSPAVLPDILFREMCKAGCFAKLDTLSILTSKVSKFLASEEMTKILAERDLVTPSDASIQAYIEKHPSFLPSPGHKLDQNYCGPFQKLAQAYEQERVKFNPGILSPKAYLADCLQSAVGKICGWVRDGRLRASGTPVQDGHEGRAREIRPSEMSETMTLGADGLLYQGPNKSGPAWKSVFVLRSDFMHCRNGKAESRTGNAEQVPIPTTAPKRKRASHERARAKGALYALYLKGIPDPSSVPNDQLLSDVNKHLAAHGLKEVKLDSLLRAAGRRSDAKREN